MFMNGINEKNENNEKNEIYDHIEEVYGSIAGGSPQQYVPSTYRAWAHFVGPCGYHATVTATNAAPAFSATPSNPRHSTTSRS